MCDAIEEALENAWGLFGGKWEVKMDFHGLGGHINDPNER
jgi:hypothetical protein